MSKLFGGGGSSGGSKSEVAMDTLIGRQTEVLGDVRFSGGLHVDGKIKGKVIADSSNKAASVSVSESGSVEGDVRVPNIMLNGRVSGDVHATERIHLAARARVNGNVYYKVIEMEAGAEINGQLVRENSGSAPQALVTHEGQAGKVEELSEIRKLKGAGG
jgi:cytoskeletal protein CcmA (bactofilin family)